MKLKDLKKKLKAKELAIKKIKNYYPYFSHMSELEIIQYLNLTDIKELIFYSNKLSISTQTHNNNQLLIKCQCIDSNGISKNLYNSYDEAQKVVSYIKNQRQIHLKIYPCPTTNGWHISKI